MVLPQVHFALALGCALSPALRIYHPDTLDAELDQAARDYINQPSHQPCIRPVSQDRGVLRAHALPITSAAAQQRAVLLPRVFKWFQDDFGLSKQEVLSFCAAYLSGPLRYALGLVRCKYRERRVRRRADLLGAAAGCTGAATGDATAEPSAGAGAAAGEGDGG